MADLELAHPQSEELALDPESMNKRFAGSGTRRMIETVIREAGDRKIALVSSFGSSSVVLLHLAASIDRSLPVLFIDTGKLFGETETYRKQIAERLGLTDVRVITPQAEAVQRNDPNGALWMRDRTACCALRKVQPFANALADFDIWISGRKRFQGGKRAELPLFEADGARLKINPLAEWTEGDIEIYRNAFSLPAHPLLAKNYRSIGCEPCTSPVAEGEDERAGRWRGDEKTECGIHIPDDMGGLP